MYFKFIIYSTAQVLTLNNNISRMFKLNENQLDINYSFDKSNDRGAM